MSDDLEYAKHLWRLYSRSVDSGAHTYAKAYLDRWYEECDRLLIKPPSRTDNLRIG